MRILMRRQVECRLLEASSRTTVLMSLLVSVLVLGLGAAAVAAAEPGQPAPEQTVAAGGLQAAIDPVTGELRAPTAAEAKALAAAMGLTRKDAGQGLVEVVWPDGTVTVDLDDSFMVFSVATVGGDGAVTLECLDHPAATDFPVATTAAPAPLEEK